MPLAWGLAIYGVILLVEAVTGAAIYQAVRNAIGDPIRPDLARKNVAQGSFALALLWPVAVAYSPCSAATRHTPCVASARSKSLKTASSPVVI